MPNRPNDNPAMDADLASALPDQAPATTSIVDPAPANKPAPTPAPAPKAAAEPPASAVATTPQIETVNTDFNVRTVEALDDLLKKVSVEPKEEPAPKKDEPAPKKEEPAPEPEKPAEPPQDEFESVELPAYAKPQTKDSFAKLKEIGRAKVAAAEAERAKIAAEREVEVAELKKRLAETEERAKAALPEDKQKEYADLKNWRDSVEIERDPQFASFDSRVEHNVEAIYGLFTEAGMTKEQLEQMKKLGGPEKVDLKALYEHMHPTTVRAIESKLIENELTRSQKNEALSQAKAKAKDFLAQRQKVQDSVVQESKTKLNAVVSSYVKDLVWAKEQPIPDKISVEQRKALEAQNVFARETQERIKRLSEDDSPESRGEMVIGTALAYYYKALADYRDKSLKDLEAKTKELETELGQIKKAAGTGRRSGVPHTVSRPSFKETMSLRPEDALDKLRKEVEASHE